MFVGIFTEIGACKIFATERIDNVFAGSVIENFIILILAKSQVRRMVVQFRKSSPIPGRKFLKNCKKMFTWIS